MVNVPNGMETYPKISIGRVRCTNVTHRRQTDGRTTRYSECERSPKINVQNLGAVPIRNSFPGFNYSNRLQHGVASSLLTLCSHALVRGQSRRRHRRRAHMQNRVPNSQRYLVNAKPGTPLTIALTLLTLMVTVSGNPNPTNPTYPTNPTNPTNPTTK